MPSAESEGDGPDQGNPRTESIDSDGFIDPDEFISLHARSTSDSNSGSDLATESIDMEQEDRDGQRTLRTALAALMVVATLTLFVVTFGDQGDSAVGEDPSTTLPIVDLESRYIDLVSSLATRVDQLGSEAGLANDQWENGTADYADTLSRLQSLVGSSLPLQATVSESEAPSDADPTLKARLVALAATLSESAEGMVAGLESSDSGEARLAALTRYEAAAAEFSTVVGTIVQNLTTGAG